ncbi:uncharacterized protein LOC110673607 [Hevea brasiliensis]|uniref:uncharacterized protein LOC110673607 n=1 Tax=Hevea brasiliensis TaxID=3981 RepID=UPI0025E6B507|nr:uncharacterized protein LOC110673607 [Hevea brasiliensis]
MGNCIGRKRAVQPLNHRQEEEDVKIIHGSTSSNKLRIKVRMTTRQLKELAAQVDLSKGNSELGRMILQQCLDGRLRACVVGGQGLVSNYANAWALSPIKED